MTKFKKLETIYINGEQVFNFGGLVPGILFPEPSPSPSPTPSATPTLTPTLTPTPTPSITPTSSPTSSPTPTPTPSITPTSSPIVVSPTPTPSITPTLTPTSSPSAIDPDAAIYLNDIILAGGVLDATMSAATNTLFTDLKANGLYSKLDVLYLMLG